MHEKIEDKICNPSPFTLASNPTRSHGSAQFLLLQDTNGCKCAPIDVWCLNLKSIAMRYCEKKVSHTYISTAACPAGHRCDDQVQTTIASSFSSDACHHKDYIWRKASLSKSKIVWTFRWKFCLFTDEQRALCKALKQKIWRSCALDGSQCAAASPWGSSTAIRHNRLMQTNVAISEHF